MPNRDRRGVKTARDDAPSPRVFRKLKRAAEDLDTFSLQVEFLLVALGDLGLRAGELTHLTADWVDLDRCRVEIPLHEDCACAYCGAQVQQHIDRGYGDQSLSFAERMESRWQPKTEASSRVIPYGYDAEYVELFDRFFEAYPEGWPRSRVSINRRVDRVAEAAGMETGAVYPHALRAHATHQYARMGLRAHHMKKVMGWVNIDAAVRYIELSAPDVEAALYDLTQQSVGHPRR